MRLAFSLPLWLFNFNYKYKASERVRSQFQRYHGDSILKQLQPKKVELEPQETQRQVRVLDTLGAWIG